MRVHNKTIMITGGGSGIGRELVLELIKRGARVTAVDINESALTETAGLLPADQRRNFSSHVLNIADKAATEALPEQVIAQHGSVDGIINNAGIIQPFVRVNDLDYTAIERVMNVNFFGTVYLVKAFLPHLLKRPEAHIVNISSMGGFLPVPGQTIYGAAKAAVKLFTEGLESELEHTPVHVTVVFPGAIATNIVANSGLNAAQMPGTTKEQEAKMKPLSAVIAAKTILDGMENNASRIFVGKDSKMLDILYRLSPKLATGLINKQMESLLPKI